MMSTTKPFLLALCSLAIIPGFAALSYAQDQAAAQPQHLLPPGSAEGTAASPAPEQAQTAAPIVSGASSDPAAPVQPGIVDPAIFAKGPLNPLEIPSILFTYWENTAIADAKNKRGVVQAPTQDEINRAMQEEQASKPKPPPEEREIKLGGIVYAAKNDWAIWLNGQRVTPDALPKEVIDLRVYDDYVEMKWLDDYTLRIYPIRLRAHQRFNLDTRMFLPG